MTTKPKIRTEHEEQIALFERARFAERVYPELKMLIAIPNGGLRNEIVAAKLKAEGVKPGVSDIFLAVPCPRNKYHGLWIELKRSDGGKGATDLQREWLLDSIKYGYAGFIANGCDKAWEIIVAYLEGKIKQ